MKNKIKKIIITLLLTLFLPLQCVAKNINVALTIDNNYPIYDLLLINSIIKNNISHSDYTFYIVEDNLTDKNKEKMKKFVEKNNQNIEFIHFDTESIDQGKYIFTFSNRITPIAIARIMLPEILPKDIDKVLYLDGDMLVTADIKPMYETDLGNYYVGMVKNINDMQYPMHIFKKGYFNSGLILMNLPKWRTDKISEKMVEFLQNNMNDFIYNKKSEKPAFLYPDQDLINIVLEGKIKKIDDKWNNQTLRKSVLNESTEGIYHYIASIKPWHFPKGRIYTQNTYMQYWKNSSLSHYRYYYVMKKIIAEYKQILKIKMNRLFVYFEKPVPKRLELLEVN